mmetsp:Transcript_25412/g.31141  ORF Transcript_25412/g.31141 Transcript_25412/m.31141 type:complete len:102 (+) Transcript_25412:382-687(+)
MSGIKPFDRNVIKRLAIVKQRDNYKKETDSEFGISWTRTISPIILTPIGSIEVAAGGAVEDILTPKRKSKELFDMIISKKPRIGKSRRVMQYGSEAELLSI